MKNMKKTVLWKALAALLIALGCVGTACAAIIPPSEPGNQIGYQAVVLCDKLTLREAPSASAKAVQTLNYGDLPIVVGADTQNGARKENGFVYVVLGDSEDSPSGWVNEGYIAVNPAWFVTEKTTEVFAWNDPAAPKVALLERDTRLPILKEEDGWILVSLRGAAGWIRN